MNFIALSGRLTEKPTLLEPRGPYDIVLWKVETPGPGGVQNHRVSIHDRNNSCSINLSRLPAGEPVLVAGYVGRTVYKHEGRQLKATEIICDPLYGFEIWFGSCSIIEGPASRMFPTWKEWVATLPSGDDEGDEKGSGR